MEENKQTPNLSAKKVGQVAKTSAIVRTNNDSKLSKLINPEDFQKMKEHVGKEVIIPYLKRTFFDAVQEALYMLLYKGQPYGKKGPNAFGSNITYGGTQYNGYFASSSLNQPPKRASEEAKEQTLNVKKGPSDLIFPSRADAEDTLIKMDEIISTYGSVSFADLEEMAGVTGDFTDNKYGWKDIRNAKVVRNALEGGYYIRMPRMIVLD